jgi:hypothetical protein
MKDFVDRWQHFWFEPIPAHIYALLRIVFGIVGCLTLIGLSDVATFWHLDGFVPVGTAGLGIKAFLLSHGLGNIAGTALYACTFLAFVSMTIGLLSGLSVALALISSLVQVSWNYLPLSGADAALKAILFCLVWADCGSVWSVDAWIARRRGDTPAPNPTYVIAPLRLVRFQVALIYLNAGLWKLMNPYWRDGTAVHYVLESNVYHRFPFGLAVPEALVAATTYGTLLWELAFAPLVLFAPTRRVALTVGILVHLGMLLTIEIGPFHLVMLASYLAFLDPHVVPALAARVWNRKTDLHFADSPIGAVRR